MIQILGSKNVTRFLGVWEYVRTFPPPLGAKCSNEFDCRVWVWSPPQCVPITKLLLIECLHHLFKSQGQTLRSPYRDNQRSQASVAERLVHLTAKQEVCSSNPGSYHCWNIHLGKTTGCFPGHVHQKKLSHQGWISEDYMSCLCKVWIRLPTLALIPRGDVTRSPKQGCQWP